MQNGLPAEARGTSVVLNFRLLTWRKKKKKRTDFELYQKLQNLTLHSCYVFTFVCTSRPHSFCHLDHNSWSGILWCALDITAYMVSHGLEGQFLLLHSKALNRIAWLLVFKKVEDQASSNKLPRKGEVSTSVV